MAWDAGAITGKLGLNVSEFGHGMLQAQGMAAVFPGVVLEFLENPLLGLVEVAKEAAEKIKQAMEWISDSVKEVGEGFDSTRLAAEKAGVGVEYFSRLSEAGKRVGTTAETLTVGFRMLSENMGLALEGQKSYVDNFARLGFSMDWVRGHMNNMQGAMSDVIEKMSAMSSPAERMTAAMRLMGRGGGDLVPLFNLGGAKIKEFGDQAASVGAVVGESQAKMGESFGEMSALFSDAWQGIKNALAEPILAALGGDSEELSGKIIELSKWIGEKLGGAIAWCVDAFKSLWHEAQTGEGVFGSMVSYMKSFYNAIYAVGRYVGVYLVAEFKLLWRIVGPILEGIYTILKPIMDGIAWLFNKMADNTNAALSFIGLGDDEQKDEQAKGGASAKSAAAAAQLQGGVNIENLNVNGVDPDRAASAIADKIQPHIKAAHLKQTHQLHLAARHQKVAHAIGGRA